MKYVDNSYTCLSPFINLKASCKIIEETTVQITQEKIRNAIFLYGESDVLMDSKPSVALSNFYYLGCYQAGLD